MSSQEFNTTTYAAALSDAIKYFQEHIGSQGAFVGNVKSGGSFPTTRQDGSALQSGDYVKPTGTLPFTIGDITFNSLTDQAIFASAGTWVLVTTAQVAEYAAQAGQYATQAGNAATSALETLAAINAKMWFGTMEEYNALTTINPETLYIITDRA